MQGDPQEQARRPEKEESLAARGACAALAGADLAAVRPRSPTAIRMCKAALNAAEDGQAGIQVRGQGREGAAGTSGVTACRDDRGSRRPNPAQELGGAATALFYQSEEGSEGRKAYAEKRAPDFSRFKRLP